jgi:hypothetical protein
VVHHADYLNAGDDRGLCGAALTHPDVLPAIASGDAVCPDCAAQLVVYHLHWWRETARAATAELEDLRAEYLALQARVGAPEPAPHAAPLAEGRADLQLVDDAAAEPATLLDRARHELDLLSKQFDQAVPYFRLKNAMQAFSDGLDTDQRVLLAEQIGSDGSLMRWATNIVETRGWVVTNSPVRENDEMMWEEWLEESQQAPKKTKRRFGRSR